MAWTIDPSNQEMAFLMEAGFLYRDLKRYREACDVFKGARALAPKSEVPEVALGTVSFQEGNFAQAAVHYHRALELNERSSWAYCHLGELALFQADKRRARGLLRAAIELDPRGDYGKFARALLDFADVVQFK